MRRPLVLLLFAAIFVAEFGWSGVAPLIPDYQDRFGLSEAQAGLVFTLASAGILIASLPAGALSRRFAVRTLTLWGMASITVGNLLLAIADAFGVILVGRVFFGIGLGTMWVAGTAWIHDAAGEHAPRALAMTTAVVGIGALLGPAFTGFVAERTTLGTPFAVLATASLLMTVALLVFPSAVGRRAEPSPPLVDMLRAMGADHLMLTSIVLTLAVSMMWMTADLLVPLRLDDHGYDAADIGLAMSLASIAFVGASALTARHAERYATIRLSAVWTLAMAAGIAIATVGSSTAATFAFLVIGGASSGVLIALTYPLGVTGARRGHFSVAVVGALLNMVWAGAGLVGPAAGGAVSEALGDQAAFLALATIAVGAAAWMWLRRDRGAVEPAEPSEAAVVAETSPAETSPAETSP
jgi:predicted MFS family arabinose efflux permease